MGERGQLLFYDGDDMTHVTAASIWVVVTFTTACYLIKLVAVTARPVTCRSEHLLHTDC